MPTRVYYEGALTPVAMKFDTAPYHGGLDKAHVVATVENISDSVIRSGSSLAHVAKSINAWKSCSI